MPPPRAAGGPVCPLDGAPLVCPSCEGRRRGMARTPRKLDAARANLARANLRHAARRAALAAGPPQEEAPP